MYIKFEAIAALTLGFGASLFLSLLMSGLWEATRETLALRRKLFYFVVLHGLFLGIFLAGEILLHSHAQYSAAKAEKPCYGPCPEKDWPSQAFAPASPASITAEPQRTSSPPWPEVNAEPPPSTERRRK